MSASIAERIRRAREGSVEIDGKTYLYHRPTDIQMAEIGNVEGGARHINRHDVVHDYVFGWKGVKESDLFPGGGDEPAPFDPETWTEYLSDDLNLWEPLYTAIMASYVEHSAERDDKVKK